MPQIDNLVLYLYDILSFPYYIQRIYLYTTEVLWVSRIFILTRKSI